MEYLTDGDYEHTHQSREYIHAFCQLYNSFSQNSFDQYLYRREIDLAAEYLLETAFRLEAKQPLDKIYGLYGVLTGYCYLPLAVPDYGKTAEEVYEETVWAWIETRGDLSILKLAARPVLIHKLPSWVPAWHEQHPRCIRNTGDSPERLQMLERSHFNWNYIRYKGPLIRETSSDTSRGNEDRVLFANAFAPGKLRILQARFAGKVSYAIGSDRSQEHGNYHGSIDCLYMHLNWCRLIRDIFFHDTMKREEALHEMYRSILYPGIHQFELGYYGLHGTPKENFESFREWFDFILYLNEASERPITASSGDADGDNGRASVGDLYFAVCIAIEEVGAASILERYYRGCGKGRDGLTKLARHVRSTRDDLVLMRNHRLCILDNDNMLAVTDYWCQEGDEVFVFPGTDSPFVLRKQPEGDCYRLVGPALVDRLLRVGYQNWRSEGDNLQNIVLI